MLTRQEVKIIRSLQTKKGRKKHGLCLVEGEKNILTAGDFIERTFTDQDTEHFDQLVTTETPQSIAATARIPDFGMTNVLEKNTVLILDGIQDPGNMGAIFRLASAFDAGLISIQSADPTNPKVVRSSAGAMFQVPWIDIKPGEVSKLVEEQPRKAFLLEKRADSVSIEAVSNPDPIYLLVGSEGSGITHRINGVSVVIPHHDRVESLNVGNAVAIALFLRSLASGK